VLQIDSHMRFRPRWDVYLISQWKKCGEPASTVSPETNSEHVCHRRVVLTTYPPNYDAPHGPGPDSETRATLLVPWKFGPDNMLRQKSRLLSGYTSNTQTQKNDNIPCLLFAGGFNFFHSSLLEDCPYDKLHGLFFGEEISMAVRLFTHGYNLFSPPQTVAYHQWNRNPLRTSKPFLFESHREAALEVVRMQLRGIGGGLGTRRSVTEFSKRLSVDFVQCKLGRDCENVRGADFVCTETKQVERFKSNDISQVLELVNQFIS
jgi:[Skp1-protein]-hydroxyproline N-acetylglucosaminyltransferase